MAAAAPRRVHFSPQVPSPGDGAGEARARPFGTRPDRTRGRTSWVSFVSSSGDEADGLFTGRVRFLDDAAPCRVPRRVRFSGGGSDAEPSEDELEVDVRGPLLSRGRTPWAGLAPGAGEEADDLFAGAVIDSSPPQRPRHPTAVVEASGGVRFPADYWYPGPSAAPSAEERTAEARAPLSHQWLAARVALVRSSPSSCGPVGDQSTGGARSRKVRFHDPYVTHVDEFQVDAPMQASFGRVPTKWASIVSGSDEGCSFEKVVDAEGREVDVEVTEASMHASPQRRDYQTTYVYDAARAADAAAREADAAIREADVDASPQSRERLPFGAPKKKVRFHDPCLTHVDEFQVGAPMQASCRRAPTKWASRMPDSDEEEADNVEVGEASMHSSPEGREYQTTYVADDAPVKFCIEWCLRSDGGYLGTFEASPDESVGDLRRFAERASGLVGCGDGAPLMQLYSLAGRRLADEQAVRSLVPAGLFHASIQADRYRTVRFADDTLQSEAKISPSADKPQPCGLHVTYGEVEFSVRWMSGVLVGTFSLLPEETLGALRLQVEHAAGLRRCSLRKSLRLVKLVLGTETLSCDQQRVADIASEGSLELVAIRTFSDPVVRWPQYVPPASDDEASSDEQQVDAAQAVG